MNPRAHVIPTLQIPRLLIGVLETSKSVVDSPSLRAKVFKQQRSDLKKIKILERDLQRKEEALAEAAWT